MNRSKRSELQNARAYGGRRNPGSGNSRVAVGNKADSRVDGKLRIEQKDPMASKFVVAAHALHQLWRIATEAGELAVYQVLTPDTRWSSIAILDADDFQQLCPENLFICVGTKKINKQATFYLDRLNWLLGDCGHVVLTTAVRDYTMTTKALFDDITRGVIWNA